jgi:serine/threonine protein kinase
MEDYEIITRLGGGSFADVYKAKEKTTGELVAIKILKRKYKKWEDCLELRECKSLQKLHDESLLNKPGEENIIKLKQIIFIKKTGTLNLVFEYMETDLLELMKSKEPKKLSEDEIRDLMHQTLLGLSFMHKYGFFHRDMKPENLLLKGKKLKLADFGLAREIRSVPPYTEYVSTRYYRAPECILQSNNYNSPIDIWGLGCIMAEMYLHPQPLFSGSNEKEVLFKICSILGTPTYDSWADGIQQAKLIGIKFPNNSGTDLEKIIPEASSEAIDLIKQMLKWDPNRRTTANNLLKHPFFTKHIINHYSYSSNNNSIFFDNENNYKKYTNKNETNDKLNKNINDSLNNKFENINIENSNNSNNITENNNNFNLGDYEDNNFGKMLNESDGFDTLLSQLKNEKFEDDKNYEKEKHQFGDEDFDISKISENYNNNEGTNFSITKSNNLFTQSLKVNNRNNKNSDNNNFFDNNFYAINDKKNNNNNLYGISKNNNKKEDLNLNNNNINNIFCKSNSGLINFSYNKKLSEKNNKQNDFNENINIKKTFNRRRSAKKFLEETEEKFKKENLNNINNKNVKDVKLMYNYNKISDANPILKNDFLLNNINIGNKDYNHFNFNNKSNMKKDGDIKMGNNGIIESFFGKGSRRKHDTNWADI